MHTIFTGELTQITRNRRNIYMIWANNAKGHPACGVAFTK